jgi:pimeloyl-ACP methyl ester carboxylesterase
MKSMFLTGVVVSALLLVTPNVTRAQDALPPGCQEASLPSHDLKFPADQLILVCIPADWIGSLVLYAHGFVPPQAPLILPIAELTLADGTFVPSVLLAQGFAFATSSFHKNGAVTQQAAKDLGDLLNYFKSLVRHRLLKLKKVFLIGASEGGLPVMRLIEQQPHKYDAALALCAPIGGASEQVQYAGDFRVVFDYFFPGVFTFPPAALGEQPFGAFSVPEDAFLFWESDYVPRIRAAISNDPTVAAQLFNVTGAAVDPEDPSTAIETAVSLLFYSIWETNDIIATTGGIPYDNRSTVYVGSADDSALNAGVERVKGDRRARSYTRRFYQTTGELQRPVVTLHNRLDPIAPFQHEVNYSQLVATAGASDFLTEVPVEGYGHCDFTAEEIFRAFGLMVQQATGSVQP